jgi:nitrogen fixation protein NifQ
MRGQARNVDIMTNATFPSSPAPGSPALSTAADARARELMGPSAPGAAPDAWLFARLIAAREVRGELAWLGVPEAHLQALAERYFAHAELTFATPSPAFAPVKSADHLDFVAALRALLLTHVAPSVRDDDAQCLAAIIAQACLRPDHLWRDLGLKGRDDVTQMLERYFPALVARNVDGLRWKRFLAQELALSIGATPGPAPGCPGCEDFHYCFPDHR